MTEPTIVQPPSDELVPTIEPFVRIGSGNTELVGEARQQLVRLVVDNKLNLPGMVELTFRDLYGIVLDRAGITIGTQVSVSATSVGGYGGNLITAEVTAIEGVMHGMTPFTTVRGYTTLHRLHRARHSKTYLNTKDSDLAKEIAEQAGLVCGTIVESSTTHAYLAQVNQTDAEFVAERALEIGYEFGVSDGEFFFRPASTVSAPAVTNAPRPLVFRANLTSFRARVTAGNLTPDVEVRVWDPMQVTAFVAPGTTPTDGRFSANALGIEFEEAKTGSSASADLTGAGYELHEGLDDVSRDLDGAGAVSSVVGSLGQLMSGGSSGGSALNLGGGLGSAGSSTAAAGSPLGVKDLGPVPSPTAHIVADRPLADASSVHTEGSDAANALAGELGVTVAEAEGDALGDPLIQPGVVVAVSNVHSAFAGEWLVSQVQHVFDDREYGYHTTFFANGRQDRSMLGLTSRALVGRRPRIEGVVCGVVSNVLDPLGRARVKVVLPWLAPDFETDWAPVGQFHAGPKTGALFVPEVGNEVLMMFEFGDPRRPYVVGSIVNAQTGWNLSSGAGPMAALSALAGGLGGAGGQIAGIATDIEGIAATIAALTPAGEAMQATGLGGPTYSGGAVNGSFSMSSSSTTDTSGLGGVLGSIPGIPGLGGAAGGMAGGDLGAVQQTPGMVGEVVRSGLVTSTGNALIFNDVPMPGMASAATGLGSLTGGSTGSQVMGDAEQVGGIAEEASSMGGMGGMGGMAGGFGGGAGGAGGGGAAAASRPLASSISLGTQAGNHGIYIDQVSSMVIMQANATPGVSTSETPMLVITTGPQGNVIINGGESLTLASDTSITMVAPEILIGGETITVAGELIPLTPG
jgi:phage protein D